MPAGLAGSPTDEDAIRPARARITTPALPARPTGAHVFGSLVAAAPAMGEVFAVMRRLAPTDITLTVIGETGTGKDVIANAIHEASSRAGGPGGPAAPAARAARGCLAAGAAPAGRSRPTRGGRLRGDDRASARPPVARQCPRAEERAGLRAGLRRRRPAGAGAPALRRLD